MDTRIPGHPEPKSGSAQQEKPLGAGRQRPSPGPSEQPHLVALLQLRLQEEAPVASAPKSPLSPPPLGSAADLEEASQAFSQRPRAPRGLTPPSPSGPAQRFTSPPPVLAPSQLPSPQAHLQGGPQDGGTPPQALGHTAREASASSGCRAGCCRVSEQAPRLPAPAGVQEPCPDTPARTRAQNLPGAHEMGPTLAMVPSSPTLTFAPWRVTLGTDRGSGSKATGGPVPMPPITKHSGLNKRPAPQGCP